jgi:hypothetical protein
MSIAANQARRVALLLFVAAQALMLAPRTSLAHGAAHHEQGTPRAGASLHDAAPSCPSAPGHVCGCDNLAALMRASEPLAIAIARTSLVAIVTASWTRPLGAAVPAPSRFSLSAASPRAPPQAL